MQMSNRTTVHLYQQSKREFLPCSYVRTGDNPIGPHKKTRPTAFSCRRIAAADPHVTACCGRMQHCGHCNAWKRPRRVVLVKRRAYLLLQSFQTLRCNVTRMVGMKNQIDVSLFVFTIEFRISVLMANQCTTSNALQIENGNLYDAKSTPAYPERDAS